MSNRAEIRAKTSESTGQVARVVLGAVLDDARAVPHRAEMAVDALDHDIPVGHRLRFPVILCVGGNGPFGGPRPCNLEGVLDEGRHMMTDEADRPRAAQDYLRGWILDHWTSPGAFAKAYARVARITESAAEDEVGRWLKPTKLPVSGEVLLRLRQLGVDANAYLGGGGPSWSPFRQLVIQDGLAAGYSRPFCEAFTRGVQWTEAGIVGAYRIHMATADQQLRELSPADQAQALRGDRLTRRMHQGGTYWPEPSYFGLGDFSKVTLELHPIRIARRAPPAGGKYTGGPPPLVF